MSLWARAQFSNPAWRPVEIFESKGGAARNFGIENFDKLARNFLAGVQLASALITKSIAASEDQAKSSVGVDATLPPGF